MIADDKVFCSEVKIVRIRYGPQSNYQVGRNSTEEGKGTIVADYWRPRRHIKVAVVVPSSLSKPDFHGALNRLRGTDSGSLPWA